MPPESWGGGGVATTLSSFMGGSVRLAPMSPREGQWSGWHTDKGSSCPPSDGRHSPVTFLRAPRSSSSQAASEPGSAAQECPVVLSAARSAAQARSWPSASTSCHQDEALKAATSSASPQAGKGRRQAGSLGPPTGYGMGGGTGFGSQNCGLISGEMTKNTFVEYEPLLREGSPAGRKGGGASDRGSPGEQTLGVSDIEGWQVPSVSTDGSHGWVWGADGVHSPSSPTFWSGARWQRLTRRV